MKSKSKAKSKAAGDDPNPTDKKAKAALSKSACDLKTKYLAVTAMQANIERNIANDPKYEWANNPVQTKRFEQVATKLQERLC